MDYEWNLLCAEQFVWNRKYRTLHYYLNFDYLCMSFSINLKTAEVLKAFTEDESGASGYPEEI